MIGRPRKCRHVCCRPVVGLFKPHRVAYAALDEVVLALLACAPCPAMAQAVALGSTQDRLAVLMNSGISSGQSSAGLAMATVSSARVATQ